jgi:hypothetical protein
VSGHTYQYTTYWHNAWVLVDDAGNGYQAANASITYTYRGRKETYEAPNICLGDLPGAGGGFCNP